MLDLTPRLAGSTPIHQRWKPLRLPPKHQTTRWIVMLLVAVTVELAVLTLWLVETIVPMPAWPVATLIFFGLAAFTVYLAWGAALDNACSWQDLDPPNSTPTDCVSQRTASVWRVHSTPGDWAWFAATFGMTDWLLNQPFRWMLSQLLRRDTNLPVVPQLLSWHIAMFVAGALALRVMYARVDDLPVFKDLMVDSAVISADRAANWRRIVTIMLATLAAMGLAIPTLVAGIGIISAPREEILPSPTAAKSVGQASPSAAPTPPPAGNTATPGSANAPGRGQTGSTPGRHAGSAPNAPGASPSTSQPATGVAMFYARGSAWPQANGHPDWCLSSTVPVDENAVVTANGWSVTCHVVDTIPRGSRAMVTLSPELFGELAPPEQGLVSVTVVSSSG
ncbi:MAG TPA: hypothetical protein VI322_05075 [Candidatus Saccharimonadia bacterium]